METSYLMEVLYNLKLLCFVLTILIPILLIILHIYIEGNVEELERYLAVSSRDPSDKLGTYRIKRLNSTIKRCHYLMWSSFVVLFVSLVLVVLIP